jgi:hypothetical protein
MTRVNVRNLATNQQATIICDAVVSSHDHLGLLLAPCCASQLCFTEHITAVFPHASPPMSRILAGCWAGAESGGVHAAAGGAAG